MAERDPKVPIGPEGRRVADNVRTLRVGARMTQGEMANRLRERGATHFHPATISQIEGGQRRITVDDLYAIAALFNLSAAEMLGQPDLVVCKTCWGAPPARFTCNDCGYGGAS